MNLHLETQLSIHVQSNCLSLVELSSFQLVHLWDAMEIGEQAQTKSCKDGAQFVQLLKCPLRQKVRQEEEIMITRLQDILLSCIYYDFRRVFLKSDCMFIWLKFNLSLIGFSFGQMCHLHCHRHQWGEILMEIFLFMLTVNWGLI